MALRRVICGLWDFNRELVTSGLDDCRDPVTRLSLLHLPTPVGVNVGLTVAKGRAIDGKDLTLTDRESADRLLAAFKALPQTALSGRDRCALPEGIKTDGPGFGVKPAKGSYPLYIIYGGLDVAALAVLDRAGGDGRFCRRCFWWR